MCARRAVACAVLLGLVVGTVATAPFDLSNVHSHNVCPSDVLIVRPATVSDVEEAVKTYSKVQPNGAGCSWNKQMFCADALPAENGDTSYNRSVNIQMRTIRPLRISVDEEARTVHVSSGVLVRELLEYLANFVTPVAPAGWTIGAFPWYVYQTIAGAVATGTHGSSLTHNSLSHQVEEFDVVLPNGTSATISEASHPLLMKAFRVSVGRIGVITSLKLRIVPEIPVTRVNTWIWPSEFLTLMEELQNSFNDGEQLPEWADDTQFFWSVQTQEVARVSFVRADELKSRSSQAELLAKLQPDESTLELISAIISEVSQANGGYMANENTQDEHPVQSADSDYSTMKMNGTLETDTNGEATRGQATNGDIIGNFTNAPTTPTEVAVNAALLLQILGRMEQDMYHQAATLRELLAEINEEELPQKLVVLKGPEGLTWERTEDIPPQQPFLITAGAAYIYGTSVNQGLEGVVGNATKEAASSYIYQPEESEYFIRNTLYSQYEVAVPISKAAECYRGAMEMFYGEDVDNPFGVAFDDTGFRTANLIRIVGKENGLLSLSNDEPRVYINFEDFIGPNTMPGGGYNAKFQDLMAYFRSSEECKGTRMHWGKSGFPEPGCFKGEKDFPDTWCDFGCVVQELDPNNKFSDSSKAWNWEGVDLESCCTANGFDTARPECTCSPTPVRTDCPESPYYDVTTAYTYWEDM